MGAAGSSGAKSGTKLLRSSPEPPSTGEPDGGVLGSMSDSASAPPNIPGKKYPPAPPSAPPSKALRTAARSRLSSSSSSSTRYEPAPATPAPIPPPSNACWTSGDITSSKNACFRSCACSCAFLTRSQRKLAMVIPLLLAGYVLIE